MNDNSSTSASVTDANSLVQAITSRKGDIEIGRSIRELDSLRLPAGIRLRAATEDVELRFKEGQPGILLSADSGIHRLRLVTDETQVALGLADDADDLGTVAVSDIVTIGRVHLEAAGAKAGAITLDRIHVERADARIAAHRPAGFGVEVLLGAITVGHNKRSARQRHQFLRSPAS